MGQSGRSRAESSGGIGHTFIALSTSILILLLALPAYSAKQVFETLQPQQNAAQSLPESPKPQNNAPPPQPQGSSASTPAPEQPSSLPSTPPPNSQQQPGPSVSRPQTEPGVPADAETPSGTAPGPQPPANVTTVPPGSVPGPQNGTRNDAEYKIRTNVNLVVVPVTVKDSSGHLVEGLLGKDFSVYEDGTKQNVSFFTSDPFPLSAAVVIDVGMSDTEVAKVRDTLPALIGAFGQFDEVSIFTYGNTVKRWQDFTAATSVTPAMLRQLKSQRGRAAGAPVVGGPFGSGPTINGRPADPAQGPVNVPTTTVRESRVLNDAVLAAAAELGKRDRTRRKVVFVVSDGREVGSTASYADVMKVLLSNGISVYGVGIGGAAIPGYGTLQKFRIPGFGYGDILPKYASATGGQVFAEFTRSAIEQAYARVTEEARNQYTLGYTMRSTPSSTYREIEVRVNRPGLKVYAKSGYYPLPAGR
jgi:VWFA-related protein